MFVGAKNLGVSGLHVLESAAVLLYSLQKTTGAAKGKHHPLIFFFFINSDLKPHYYLSTTHILLAP